MLQTGLQAAFTSHRSRPGARLSVSVSPPRCRGAARPPGADPAGSADTVPPRLRDSPQTRPPAAILSAPPLHGAGPGCGESCARHCEGPGRAEPCAHRGEGPGCVDPYDRRGEGPGCIEASARHGG